MRPVGRVVDAGQDILEVAGTCPRGTARRPGRVSLRRRAPPGAAGPEARSCDLAGDRVTVLADGDLSGLAIGDPVRWLGPCQIAPDDSWIGRVIDPMGQAAGRRRSLAGQTPRPLRAEPPAAATGGGWGRGWRPGLRCSTRSCPSCAGSGSAFSPGPAWASRRFCRRLARGVAADVVVIALDRRTRARGARVRAQRAGPAGHGARVVVAATSDQSPLVRRRCAWAAMAVAEHFRDPARRCLFLADSITRFAEAHREMALAAGEAAALRGFPPSIAPASHRCANAPGRERPGAGDITAVLSVLVAGSDMEEPVADMLRGVLDGHVVLDRKIAERGRFPAIDVSAVGVARAARRGQCGRERADRARAGPAGHLRAGRADGPGRSL